MRLLLGLVFVVGCVQAGTSPRRWPNHRTLRDQELTQIKERTNELEQRVEQLTRELASTKAALAKLQTSQAAAQAVPSELPKSGGATP